MDDQKQLRAWGSVCDGRTNTFFDLVGTADQIAEFLNFQAQFGAVYVDGYADA